MMDCLLCNFWVQAITAVVLLLSTAYLWGTWTFDYFKIRGIDYVKPKVFFGNLKEMATQKESFMNMLEKLYNTFPNNKAVGVFELRNPTLMIRDPALIKQLMIKDFDHFVNHRVLIDEQIEPLFGRNLFSLSGKRWKHMRSTLSPAFTGSKLRHMMPFIDEVCNEITEHFLNESASSTSPVVVEMKDMFTKITNDIIATCAFGIKVNSIKDTENHFYKTGKSLTAFGGLQTIIFLGYAVAPKLMNFFKIKVFRQSTIDFFKYLTQDTIRYREENNTIRPDMVHLLMEAKRGRLKDDDSNAAEQQILHEDDLIAQCLLFFIAGFETSSSLMCFASHEITANPDVQAKLLSEIDEMNESLNGRMISYEDLSKMKYMDMMISETLRKWPPAVLTDRICTKPYTLKTDSQVINFNVGDAIWIPIGAIHRDAKYYPEPERFDPERFTESNRPTPESCTYLPFGVGPRNCIGLRFAIMECKMVLFKMLSKFTFEVSEKTQIPLQLAKSGFAMKAEKGFWTHLKPRFKSS